MAGPSNFPNGFTQGITIRGLPIHQAHPGEVFWVNGSTTATHLAKGAVGGSDGNDGSYRRPFKTIDYAVSQCSAGRGDIILVMPNYTQTISAADGVDVDVAGVAVVGLGAGSSRPTFTHDTAAAADVALGAANVSWVNMIHIADYDGVTHAIDIESTDAYVGYCEFRESGADDVFIDYIDASSASANGNDGLWVEGCKGYAIDDQMDSFIETTETLDRLVVKNCYWCSAHASTLGFLETAASKPLTNVLVDGCIWQAYGKTAGHLLLPDNSVTTNNGMIVNCRIGHLDSGTEAMAEADVGFSFCDNLATGALAASGYPLPAVDS